MVRFSYVWGLSLVAGLALSCASSDESDGSPSLPGGTDVASTGGVPCEGDTCSAPSDSLESLLEGLPSGDEGLVLSLALAEAGQVWVGTAAGLVRVELADGAIERYTSADSELRSDYVSAVIEGPQQGIWVGYGDSACAEEASGRCGLSRLDPDTGAWEHHTAESSGLIDDRVQSLGRAATGHLLAGTSLGAMLLSSGNWSLVSGWHDCSFPGEHCTAVWSVNVADIEADDAATWFALDTMAIGISPKPGGVARQRVTGEMDTWDMDDGLASHKAECLVMVGDELLVGSEDGLGRFVSDAAGFDWLDEQAVFGVAAPTDGPAFVARAAGVFTWQSGGDLVAFSLSGLPGPEVTVVAAQGELVCFGGSAFVQCLDTAASAWVYPRPDTP